MKLKVQGGKSVQKKRWPFFFFFGGAEPSALLFVPFDCDRASSEAAGWSPVGAAEFCLASASSAGLEVSSADCCWGVSFIDTSSDGAERFTGRKDDIAMTTEQTRGVYAGEGSESDGRCSDDGFEGANRADGLDF